MSTPDKTHGTVDVPETEFGEKEQSRLAELLGIARECDQCRKKPHEVNHPRGMIFAGFGIGWIPCLNCNKPIPIGLALIEKCRKRGVQISVDSFMDGYEVECFQGGRFVFRVECQFTDLESAIAIAALKGLEALENTNECKAK